MTRSDDQADVADEAAAALPEATAQDEQAAPAARAVREPLIGRHFTQPGEDVYGQIEWTYRTAAITSDSGETIFEQSDIETPAFWSQTATNIVASKYFWGHAGTDERESSMKTLVDRVVETITRWGRAGGYFSDGAAASAFSQELRYLLINQYAAFNSPVWFNVGVEETPQCSACFINSVEDTMQSIIGPGQDARGCCSNSAAAPAATSRRFVPRPRRWPAAERPPARSPSCAASTPSPA